MDYKNKNLPIKKRINNLISLMSVDEKIAQLGCIKADSIIINSEYVGIDILKKELVNGLGQITRIGGAGSLENVEGIKVYNDIQKYLVEKTRLGIPMLNREEALCGWMAPSGTSFPQGINQGSTFNIDLIEKMAKSIKEEMAASYVDQIMAPNIDLGVEPRWGRQEETWGEDPYLVSQFAIPYINAIQKEDVDLKPISACAKHFVAHGFPQGGRNHNIVRIGYRELRETHAKPFIAAITKANVTAIMPAYHELDGIGCHGNKELLTDFLRGELNFKGQIISDATGIEQLESRHHHARNLAEAAAIALNAGVDTELPKRLCFSGPLKQALIKGLVDEKVLNKRVSSILKVKFELGLFEHPYKSLKINSKYNSIKKIKERELLSLKVAEESITLVKNSKILPLKKNQKIGLFGAAANNARVMLGDYNFTAHINKQKNDTFKKYSTKELTELGVVEFHGKVDNGLSLKESFDKLLIDYKYCEGYNFLNCGEIDIDGIKKVANKSDVFVVVISGKSGLDKTDTSGEFRDRVTLNPPGKQEELITELKKYDKPIVTIAYNGRAWTMGKVNDLSDSVVIAWLPGVQGGVAVANILFGNINPSGRLPVSFVKSVGQLPWIYNHKPLECVYPPYFESVEGIDNVVYPFGHGLSYSKVIYSDLEMNNKFDVSESVKGKFKIKNDSDIEVNEVVQLYVKDHEGQVTRPVKQLVGFEKINLKPKEEKTIKFSLPKAFAAFIGIDKAQYIVEPGMMTLFISKSSSNDILKKEFKFIGELLKVDTPSFERVRLIKE